MWGNALGWFISLCIAVATVGGLVMLRDRISSVTPTTELSRRSASPFTLAVSPKTILPQADETDGTSEYRAALAVVSDDRATYVDFSRRGNLADLKRLRALEQLIHAASHGRATIFADAPARVINYKRPNEALDTVELLGQCAVRGALLQQQSDPAQAIRLAEASVALGARLFEERLTLAEMRAGVTLMAQGAQIVSAADPARAPAARQLADALRNLTTQQIEPLSRAIVTIDPGVLSQHSGDVLQLARSAGERMWQVEAILALGRMRFNAAQVGDQRAAARVIERLTNDPDPIIRAAAAAAKNLPADEYGMQG
jgi:hypothetical protein